MNGFLEVRDYKCLPVCTSISWVFAVAALVVVGRSFCLVEVTKTTPYHYNQYVGRRHASGARCEASPRPPTTQSRPWRWAHGYDMGHARAFSCIRCGSHNLKTIYSTAIPTGRCFPSIDLGKSDNCFGLSISYGLLTVSIRWVHLHIQSSCNFHTTTASVDTHVSNLTLVTSL